MIVDFHTHVIPGIDDGARDIGVSLELMRRSAEQGVEVMVATPHFYATRDRVEDFLQRRQAAYESLCESMTPGLPRIVLGAEVAFFEGISGARHIRALTIDGTDVLLLEMPFRPWTDEMVDEVEAMTQGLGCQVMLAHLERYIALGENRAQLDRLTALKPLVQINAESLLDWRLRGRIMRMFESGKAHLLGSDCHSLHRRPPNLGEGREALVKKLGQAFLEDMDRLGERVLLG